MPRKPAPRLERHIDPALLAEFQAGLRKRYTDQQILDELKACAARLGRSPTMREFAADPQTTVHPQTVIEHFGSWNAAKRDAGLVPRRFATRGELLRLLRELGEERVERAVEQGVELAHRLGRLPKFADWAERRKSDESLFTEWQVYRMFDARRGAWATFQYLVRERLLAEGAAVMSDGRLA